MFEGSLGHHGGEQDAAPGEGDQVAQTHIQDTAE